MKKCVNKKLSLVLLLSIVSDGKLFSIGHGGGGSNRSHNPVQQNQNKQASNNSSNNNYADDTYSNGTFAGNNNYFGSGFRDYSNGNSGMNNNYYSGVDTDTFINSLYNQNPQQFDNFQGYEQLTPSQQQQLQQQMAQQLVNGQTQASTTTTSSSASSPSSSSNSSGGSAIGLSDIINVAIAGGVIFVGVKGIISLVHYLKDRGVKVENMTEAQIDRALVKMKKALARKGVDIDSLEVKQADKDQEDAKDQSTTKDGTEGAAPKAKKRLSDEAEGKRAKLKNAQDELDRLNKAGVKDKGFLDKVNGKLNDVGGWVKKQYTSGKAAVKNKLQSKDTKGETRRVTPEHFDD